MENKMQEKAIQDLVYLISCAVNQTSPAPERLQSMDLSAVFEAADQHSVSAATAYALESAGVKTEQTRQAIAKAVRSLAIMEEEKLALFERLEQAGIWYMPLKGAVLKDYYPIFGMREMGDYDILFDDSRAEDVKNIMEELGFTTQQYGPFDNHDVYFKPPVSNFEMHRKLFDVTAADELADYNSSTAQRLLKDEGNRYGYHFSWEDFYVYLTLHEYKHFQSGGTGLRSLLDTYVFLKRFGNELHWDHVKAECGKLNLTNFECLNRDLSRKLFAGQPLSQAEAEMFHYVIGSGTYGTLDHFIQNRIGIGEDGHTNKLGYIFRRIFLPMDVVRRSYPLFYRHPLLLPFLPFYRLAISRQKHTRLGILRELKQLRKMK